MLGETALHQAARSAEVTTAPADAAHAVALDYDVGPLDGHEAAGAPLTALLLPDFSFPAESSP